MKTEIEERKKLLVAMEYIMRNLNDEDDFSSWLCYGVPDCDIPYGNFNTNYVHDFYVSDEECFKTIVGTFIETIKYMEYDGITCGGITSPSKKEYKKLMMPDID